MVRKSDRIENPITGETIIFLQNAEDTQGSLLQLELQVKPGGFVAAPHIHPEQEERFLVKTGVIRLRVGDDERLLNPGQEGVVPAGTPHVWWNGGEDNLDVLVEFRPALHTREVLSTLFALARDGQTDKKGVPNLLQIAVMLRQYRSEIYLAKPPVAVQKVLSTILAPIGRLLGYQADYPNCPGKKNARLEILEAPDYSGC